jgi:2-oxoglutarate ferredoxin oxidoreductase subunit alpha
MAEIFSGDIDFHRELRKGDTFSIVYEAVTADGEPVPWNQGSGRVLAAEFINGGKTHQAIWFESGGKGAYFVRGSGHDKHAGYTEDSDAYMEVVDRLRRKFAHAATIVPKPAFTLQDGADIGLVTIGGCDAAVREAADTLRAQDILVDVMRIRAFPFGEEVKEFLEAYDRVFVIEQNRDGQLRALLAIELGIPRDDMNPILDYGGMPLMAKVVVDAVCSHLAGVTA